MLTLAGVATAAAGAFAALAVLERDRRLTKHDSKALEKVAERVSDEHREVAESLHPYGKWWWYAPAAAAAGAVVCAIGSGGKRERVAGAGALLLSAATSAFVNPLFDKLLPQPPAPPGRESQPKPSFPSGHTFGLGSVALTVAYLFSREEIIAPVVAVPLALLPPLIGGGARMIEEKHWPSEVAGGLLVAVIIASLSSLAYERERAQATAF
jgi:membrane-associated phospholipid phosphatase